MSFFPFAEAVDATPAFDAFVGVSTSALVSSLNADPVATVLGVARGVAGLKGRAGVIETVLFKLALLAGLDPDPDPPS